MRLIPAFLSCLILAAHFFRSGNLLGFLISLAVPILAAAVRRRWALRSLQGLLVFAAVLWPTIALAIAGDRMIDGRPALRMTLILCGVGLFSAYSAWLLSRPAVLERYPA